MLSVIKDDYNNTYAALNFYEGLLKKVKLEAEIENPATKETAHRVLDIKASIVDCYAHIDALSSTRRARADLVIRRAKNGN